MDKVKLHHLEAGALNTSWALGKRHRAVTDEQSSGLLTKVPIGGKQLPDTILILSEKQFPTCSLYLKGTVRLQDLKQAMAILWPDPPHIQMRLLLFFDS